MEGELPVGVTRRTCGACMPECRRNSLFPELRLRLRRIELRSRLFGLFRPRGWERSGRKGIGRDPRGGERLCAPLINEQLSGTRRDAAVQLQSQDELLSRETEANLIELLEHLR